MEYFLFTIIILQLAYAVHKDILFSKEREKLQVMIKSNDVGEYKHAVEEPIKPKEPVKEPDEYMNIEDVPIDRIIKAKEKL